MADEVENRQWIKLPEGIDIAITPAGILARSYAYMVDLSIRIGAFLVIVLIFSFFGKSGVGIILVGYFVLTWGYNIFFESRNGQTPGKKIFKLQVVQDNGLPASFSQIVIRNLLRPADIFPFGYFLGLCVMTFNPRFKRIGDWAASTMVVYLHQSIKRPVLPDGAVESPSLIFSTEEQQVILSFTERYEELSQSRRIELANILAPTLGLNAEEAENRLNNYARYFAGYTHQANDELQPKGNAL